MASDYTEEQRREDLKNLDEGQVWENYSGERGLIVRCVSDDGVVDYKLLLLRQTWELRAWDASPARLKRKLSDNPVTFLYQIADRAICRFADR